MCRCPSIVTQRHRLLIELAFPARTYCIDGNENNYGKVAQLLLRWIARVKELESELWTVVQGRDTLKKRCLFLTEATKRSVPGGSRGGQFQPNAPTSGVRDALTLSRSSFHEFQRQASRFEPARSAENSPMVFDIFLGALRTLRSPANCQRNQESRHSYFPQDDCGIAGFKGNSSQFISAHDNEESQSARPESSEH
jgi:hypothetical protein